MKPRVREWWEAVFRAGAAGDRPDWAVVEWYAQDCGGRLGVFEAVGQPIPRATFNNLDAYLTTKDAIYSLPCVTQAVLFVGGTRKETAWARQLAERGLYVFDSWEGKDWQKGYRFIAAPKVPLLVDQLSKPLFKWFSLLRLKRAEFRLANELPQTFSDKNMEWVGLTPETET
jgi:hypothetical protein